MSDRPESIPADPPRPDVGFHALREVCAVHFRPEDAAVLTTALDLTLSRLLEGGENGRRSPDLGVGSGAVAAELGFSARYLATMGEGSTLEFEEEQLARFCRDLGR